MLRELLAKEGPDNKTKQENERPPGSSHETDAAAQQQKDDEEFVPVSHQDVQDHEEEMEEVDSDQTQDSDEMPSSQPDNRLQRMSGNLLELDEDDANHSFLHPLMGHLQGRLMNRSRGVPNKFDPLHPYTTVLSLSDLEECIRVEEEAFPEHERCSREKFIYRLTKCPELSFGIYSRPTGSQTASSTSSKTDSKSPPPRNEAAKNREDKLKAATVEAAKPELIAHIIATRTPAPCVTDASMDIPAHWQTQSTIPAPDKESEHIGHSDQGGTICIHSLAVGKAHQRKSLGSTLLKAYIQRIKDSKTAERVALLAHDHLIKFYENNGFQDMGESTATFGGGNWKNMIMEFKEDEDE